MLLIASKSPFCHQHELFYEIVCRAAEKEKAGILHVQDACIATTLGEYCRKAANDGVNLYVLEEDCQARGLLGKVQKSVKIITYEDCVELLMDKYERIVS